MPHHSASTALPYPHLDRATAGLRAQLRHRLAADELADWSTLEVQGPAQVPGARGRVWFEYRATVHTRNMGARGSSYVLGSTAAGVPITENAGITETTSAER